MAESNRKLEKARKAVQDLLDAKNFKGSDPKQRLASLDNGIKDAETEIRKTEADYNGNVRDKGKLEVEIEKLEDLQSRQNPAKPDKEVVDPEYEKEQKQLEKQLRTAEQALQKAKGTLGNTQVEYDAKKGLFKTGGVTILDWNNVNTRLNEAKAAVVNGQKDVDELRRDLTQLRPGMARLREARKDLKLVNKLLDKNRNDLEQQKLRLEDPARRPSSTWTSNGPGTPWPRMSRSRRRNSSWSAKSWRSSTAGCAMSPGSYASARRPPRA